MQLHAQYSKREQPDDQYSIHRICQSYQLAKYINLMTKSSSFNNDGHNLVILAGDLNTSCNEFPYKVLGTI